MRIIRGRGSNILRGLFHTSPDFIGEFMETGKFYFIKNEYYEKFENCNLLGNKIVNGELHGRPCYYCFEKDGLYWMVPISSKVEKYEHLYEQKMARYHGKFDGIRFGYVNGERRAFLIQNVCPVTTQYIDKKYKTNKDTEDVTINENLQKELDRTVTKVINLYKRGTKIVLTDLDTILKDLI